MEIPEWIVTLVGRLSLENEALRRELAKHAEPTANGQVPEPEPEESWS